MITYCRCPHAAAKPGEGRGLRPRVGATSSGHRHHETDGTPPASADALGTLCAGLAVTISAASAGAQAPGPQPALSGDEARRVQALTKAIDELERQGKYAEAVAPAREVFAIRRRVRGEAHWETISARFVEQKETRMAGLPAGEQSALAATLAQYDEASKLYMQGRYADSEKILGAILDVCHRTLGEDHPDTATARESLAACLVGRGRSADAEPIVQQALASRLRTLGGGHPETANTYNTLAVTLDARARYEESEPMHRQALAIRRDALGEDHPDTANSYHNLGAQPGIPRAIRRGRALPPQGAGDPPPRAG